MTGHSSKNLILSFIVSVIIFTIHTDLDNDLHAYNDSTVALDLQVFYDLDLSYDMTLFVRTFKSSQTVS